MARSDTETKAVPISRRRLLAVTGAAVAGGAAAMGSAAADSTGTGTTSAGGSGETADPVLGGGEGYENVVGPDQADVVAGTQSELEDALSSAASGDVVYVAGDAEIEHGDATFTVPGGVTLASDRGIDGAAGGLLRTDSETDSVQVEGDARVTGLRVQGPYYEYFDPDWYAEGTGLRVDGGVEVDNCEIWGFADSSVTAEGDAHVHHSHVHHNARDGLGYGVICSGGHPLVEWNYFNYNRHSVASTGGHHGYTVRYNHFGTDATDVVIDIHDPGGVESEVHNNIVQAVEDISGEHDPLQAIQVRGVPEETYAIHDNWFFNPQEPRDSPAGSWTNEAIIQPTENEWQNVEFQDNYYGEDANVSASDVIPGYGN